MKRLLARSSKLLLPALGAAFLFASCGDDKSSGQTIVQPDQQSHIVVAILEDAGLCDWNRYGQIALVTLEDREYVCNGEKWELVYYEPDWSSEGGESSQSGEGGEGGGESSEGGFGNSSTVELSSSSVAENFCEPGSYDPDTHLCDARDGQLYETVQIGSQTWMKENLNFDYKIGGVSYGSYCYKDEPDSCAKYGKLYTWAAAMDSAVTNCGYGADCAVDTGMVQGVCPDGWHLPSQAEWDTLVTAVGGISTAGTALRTETGWYKDAAATTLVPATNSSGFSALPSGQKTEKGVYSQVPYTAYIWSSSELEKNVEAGAYSMTMFSTSASASAGLGDLKNRALAVRCLKN